MTTTATATANLRPLYLVTFKTADGSEHCAEGTFERINSARKLRDRLAKTTWAISPRVVVGGIGGMEVA